MGRPIVAIVVASLVAAAAAACVLDIPDVITDAGGDASGDVSAVDAADGGDGALVPTCGAGACSAPAGFAPILFAQSRTASCPAGLETFDVAADPGAAPPEACPCDCNVTSPPTCLPKVLVHAIDDDGGACGTTSVFEPVADGGCNAQTGVSVSTHWQLTPFPPTSPGSCAGTAIADASAVPTSAARLCVDPACGTCAAPAGFEVCFAADGDTTCPPGMTKHLAGAAPSVACGACSACAVSGECGGTVALYNDPACQTPIGTVAINGACNATGSNGSANLGSLEYAPSVVALACKPGKASPAGTTMTSPVTVCCP